MTACEIERESRTAHNGLIAGKPIRLCLLIGSLEFGGAERQVIEMVRAFDRNRVRPIICSLSRHIPLADSLPNVSDLLHIVEKHGRYDVTAILRLAALLRRYKIDVIHAFLFDAEIIGRLAAPLAGVRAVVSSERNTEYNRPLVHRLALKCTRPLFDVMVANSNAGREFNIRTQGLEPSRVHVVHNGVDTARFYPDPEAGHAYRMRLGIPADARVVGMVASYKRHKGHDNFMHMAHIVRQSFEAAKFMVVGGLVGDPDESRRYQDEVRSLCASLNLNDCCVFVDNQKDMNSVYNACDVTTLLSRREGTPNTVLESMACGVPVVASDVADNAFIVSDGRSGFVVPVDDYRTAAAHVCRLLDSEEMRLRVSTAARIRVYEEFSLERAVRKLERIYLEYLVNPR